MRSLYLKSEFNQELNFKKFYFFAVSCQTARPPLLFSLYFRVKFSLFYLFPRPPPLEPKKFEKFLFTYVAKTVTLPQLYASKRPSSPFLNASSVRNRTFSLIFLSTNSPLGRLSPRNFPPNSTHFTRPRKNRRRAGLSPTLIKEMKEK